MHKPAGNVVCLKMRTGRSLGWKKGGVHEILEIDCAAKRKIRATSGPHRFTIYFF